jgi:predicted membrane-bound spermidine synthase
MNEDTPRAGIGVYVGLLLTTLCTLAYQLLLTRIFSVTMWYHYTFVAISVTMFGMTVGAILVYLLPRLFPAGAARQRMALAGSCFGVLILLSFAIHVRIPFVRPEDPLRELWLMAGNYALLSLPFIASGVCVTIALTRFPRQLGKLYAADLVGAGLGCLLVAVVARWIDAPTLILDVAALAAFGALWFLLGTRARPWSLVSLVALFLLVIPVSLSTKPAGQRAGFVQLYPVKDRDESIEPPIYERWNAYSRVAVWEAGTLPVGWGLSERFTSERPIPQKWLNVDAFAGTVLTQFDGDLAPLEFLRYDVTNLVHYIRRDARVLVVGSGGGRDILSALYFRQSEIVGVEINEAILQTVNGKYGDFTGHLDRRPEVTLINDEARSYIARADRQFDIIQVSLVDTWAATAAGAYVLTENALYTTEAWKRMLERLSDRGVISFSRWHSAENPGEVYRLAALAVATLKELQVANPADHLLIVLRPRDPNRGQPVGLATLLVSRSPFSSEDVATTERVADEMAFEVLLSPRQVSPDGSEHADATLRRLASGEDFEAFIQSYPIDISPPTDDRPFFFAMMRLGDLWSFDELAAEGVVLNVDAILTLGTLLATVVVLTGLCVILPLGLTALSRGRQALRGSLPLFVYFCSIGLGFMLVEIGMIQRLNVFLGHPIYSMTVVLFCLLLATGCGSWLSGLLVRDPLRGPQGPACLAALVGVVLLLGVAAPELLFRLDALPTPGRIAVACGLLLPMGLVMGAGFPLGMRAASRRAAGLTPWLFGMNGATSICGSVLGVVISLCLGITAALLVGVACYVGALLSLVWARRRRD